MGDRVAYLFLDEGGDLNFSKSGSKYFTLTSVLAFRPFVFYEPLANLRFDLIENGVELECFHASEDSQVTRNAVFDVIENHLDSFRADSVIVEKRKTGPSLQAEAKFYPRMLGYLLRYVLGVRAIRESRHVVIITDRLPLNKKRKAIEKTIKQSLSQTLPTHIRHRIMHHESKSCFGLQIADYFNWAIFRKWKDGDNRSLSRVAPAVKTQFDIFRNGTIFWY